MKPYILALDQGTTSSRALLVDREGKIISRAQQEFTQYFPRPGWVEHDPMEIWDSQLSVLKDAIAESGISPAEIAAIGITNQRETTVVWNKNTGKPIYNALVWQDKRTAPMCEDWKNADLVEEVKQRTGLVIDSYFSASKIKWLLDNVPGARQKAESGDLLFGTVDSWLIWNMTNGKVHATDYSNASRTMIYNIHDLEWDTRLPEAFDIPQQILPEVKSSSGNFGNFELDGHSIPIAGVAGDQQSALFGQTCFEPGMAKNTYGTGCFLLMNTGFTPQLSNNGLLTTIAWGIDGKVEYALEGSVFIAGAAIQWLRDGLKIIGNACDSEPLAQSVKDQHDVYMVPAFAGLGAPYWDMYARGAIFGLTRDTRREHIVKATLDSLAYQTKDILLAMEEDSGIKLQVLNVDGGASANNYLMQFQADILGVPVQRPANIESTAMGAAYLAGLHKEIWTKDDILAVREMEAAFEPAIDKEKREKLYAGWKNSVLRCLGV